MYVKTCFGAAGILRGHARRAKLRDRKGQKVAEEVGGSWHVRFIAKTRYKALHFSSCLAELLLAHGGSCSRV